MNKSFVSDLLSVSVVDRMNVCRLSFSNEKRKQVKHKRRTASWEVRVRLGGKWGGGSLSANLLSP